MEQRLSAGELRSIVRALKEHERRLDESDERQDRTEERLGEHEGYFAILDRAQQSFEYQIEIFRTAINEQFKLLREEVAGAKTRTPNGR